jgi:prepilin-type processing-associated H-X9-DG protein/prepilin-type N-terminal cleavage/methylation domain-containing protein
MRCIARESRHGWDLTWSRALRTIPIVVAMLFILAATAKYFDLQRFSETVGAYTVFPPQVRHALPVLVPSVEMWVGCLMLVRSTRLPASIAGLVLLLSFSAFQGWLLLHPEAPACHCYGAMADWLKLQIDERFALARNVLLIAGLTASLFAGVNPLRKENPAADIGAVARRLAAPRAFSMIELLVVIGLITVLLGILLPVAGKLRVRSQSLACQSQLRSIAQAAIARAAETNGYLPLAGRIVVDQTHLRPQGLPRGLNDPARRRYAYAPDAGANVLGVPTKEFSASFAQSLLPWLGASRRDVDGLGTTDADQFLDARFGELRVFRCSAVASDPDYESKHAASIRQNILESTDGSGWESWWWLPVDYAFNGDLMGFHCDDAYLANRLRGHLAACRAPSQTLLLADAACQPPSSVLNTWATALDASPGVTTLRDVLSRSRRLTPGPKADPSRHSGRINVCFVDGHVESVHIDDASRQSEILLSGR